MPRSDLRNGFTLQCLADAVENRLSVSEWRPSTAPPISDRSIRRVSALLKFASSATATKAVSGLRLSRSSSRGFMSASRLATPTSSFQPPIAKPKTATHKYDDDDFAVATIVVANWHIRRRVNDSSRNRHPPARVTTARSRAPHGAEHGMIKLPLAMPRGHSTSSEAALSWLLAHRFAGNNM